MQRDVLSKPLQEVDVVDLDKGDGSKRYRNPNTNSNPNPNPTSLMFSTVITQLEKRFPPLSNYS